MIRQAKQIDRVNKYLFKNNKAELYNIILKLITFFGKKKKSNVCLYKLKFIFL